MLPFTKALTTILAHPELWENAEKVGKCPSVAQFFPNI
jgi:hypothetical protein